MGYKWCKYFNVWCNEAEDIVEESDVCDFDCNDCDYEEEIKNGRQEDN